MNYEVTTRLNPAGPAGDPHHTTNQELGSRVQLPLDREHAGGSEYEAAECPCVLPPANGDPGRATQLAAFVALLYKYTRQPQITVQCRNWQEDSVGRITVTLSGRVTVAELIAQVRNTLENARPDLTEIGPANVAVDWMPGPHTGQHDLRLELAPATRLVYNARLFDGVTVRRLADNLARLYQAITAQPDAPLSSLEMIGAEEWQTVCADGPTPSADHDALRPIHEDFQRWCAQAPEAPAVRFADTHLSYRELDEQSNRLARHLLQDHQVAAGDAVAVCLRPSVDQLVAMLAIFKTGAVYMPLDPTHPASLSSQMLEEAQPSLIIATPGVGTAVAWNRCPTLELDAVADRLASLDAGPLDIEVPLDARCYLLFTSGTTGKPKGVGATHRNLAHYLQVARETFGFKPDDVFCSIARYTFSISMFELLSPLGCGGSVRLLERDHVLDPERFSAVLREVTVLHAGPSLLSSVFRYLRTSPTSGRPFTRMRHASSGGDVVPPHIMEEMKAVFPEAEIYVLYGCTEVSCMGCYYAVPRGRTVERSYVGRPFPSVQVRVLDEDKNPVPIGAVGEICFAGQGLVPGYLNRPELNAEKFIQLEGRRFYQTGDLGRFDRNGDLEILGRRDFQVQLRGMRVELIGIENTIRELGLAAQCAVALKRLDEQDMRLVAFLVQPAEQSPESIRRILAEHLPDYMLPQHVMVLDALPLTANGKLDRRALQELPWRPQTSAGTGAAPRNLRESKIAAAFCEALELPGVGIDDNFFDLGGHSLTAVLLTSRLEDTLGMNITPGAVFEAPTVRSLAEHLDGSAGTTAHRPIRLTQGETAPPLFLIAAVHLYRDLARCLEHRYTVYAVYADAELSLFEAQATAPPVAALAAQYVDIIRRQQPHGPYRVAGLSFGGIVVYEVAQQLAALGEEVIFVGLLDAVLPEPGLRGKAGKLRRFVGLGLRNMAGLAAERARDRLRRALSQRRVAEFSQHQEDEKLSQMEVMREDAYAAASGQYVRQVRSLPAPVTLIAAGKRLSTDPLKDRECGWRRHVPTLDAHVVDAEHLDLLRPPWVDEVAAIMLNNLQKVDPQTLERKHDKAVLGHQTGGVRPHVRA